MFSILNPIFFNLRDIRSWHPSSKGVKEALDISSFANSTVGFIRDEFSRLCGAGRSIQHFSYWVYTELRHLKSFL